MEQGSKAPKSIIYRRTYDTHLREYYSVANTETTNVLLTRPRCLSNRPTSGGNISNLRGAGIAICRGVSPRTLTGENYRPTTPPLQCNVDVLHRSHLRGLIYFGQFLPRLFFPWESDLQKELRIC